MLSIEAGLVIGGLLGTITMCIVKIITQLENSRCSSISNCCGASCIRDVEIPVEEVETSEVSTQTRPTLDIPQTRVEQLRSRFE